MLSRCHPNATPLSLATARASSLAPSRVAPTSKSSSLWPRLSSHARARASRRRCETELTIVALIGGTVSIVSSGRNDFSSVGKHSPLGNITRVGRSRRLHHSILEQVVGHEILALVEALHRLPVPDVAEMLAQHASL